MRRYEAEPAAREVPFEQALEELLTVVIEGGERLVERPKRRGVQDRPRQPKPRPLPRREPASREHPALLEAGLGERGATGGERRGDAAQRERALQILLGAQVVLDAGKVAAEKKVRAK